MTAVYVSLRLDAGEFGDLAPLLGFRQHVSLQVLRASAGGLGAELAQARDPILGLEELVDAGIEPDDDLLRRLRRRADGEPRRRLVAGHAGFGDGRNLRSSGHRVAVETARARIWPPSANGCAAGRLSIITWTRPAIRSVSAGALPL